MPTWPVSCRARIWMSKLRLALSRRRTRTPRQTRTEARRIRTRDQRRIFSGSRGCVINDLPAVLLLYFLQQYREHGWKQRQQGQKTPINRVHHTSNRAPAHLDSQVLHICLVPRPGEFAVVDTDARDHAPGAVEVERHVQRGAVSHRWRRRSALLSRRTRGPWQKPSSRAGGR